MKGRIIKTKDFTLRPPKMEDASSLARHVNDKEVARNTLAIPYPYQLKDAKSWLKRTTQAWRKQNPEKLNFLIEIDGEAVGAIGLEDLHQHHKAELGYWLARKHWGKQIMTRAINEVTKFGFNELKLKRITAQVFTFNSASKRVLEKNGFKEEGLLRKEAKKDNKYLDLYLMAKIK
jgi:RimJ/RimL family protein N-acetyltransferase